MDLDIDDNITLSFTLGTETLAARDMISESFDNHSRARGLSKIRVQGKRYLVIK